MCVGILEGLREALKGQSKQGCHFG